MSNSKASLIISSGEKAITSRKNHILTIKTNAIANKGITNAKAKNVFISISTAIHHICFHHTSVSAILAKSNMELYIVTSGQTNHFESSMIEDRSIHALL
jgi:hypothetical protein